MHLSQILTHLGEEREKYFQAVSPPVIQSSNFMFRDLAELRNSFSNELAHHIYTRGNNPTVEILRKKIAALEGAEDALMLGSGSAAVAAAVISQVQAGDHIVCVQAPYSWTNHLIGQLLPRFGVEHTFVDGRDLTAIKNAVKPNTRLLYLESPNTMTFDLQDLVACAQLAKEKGIITCIDNSYASPLFQNPIRFGIDLVIHSATKYLNGHSDVVMGAICGRRELIQQIFDNEFMTLGATVSPHDAALVLRGLRTLELRLERSNASAWKIAQFLENHSKVEQVRHPFLPSFPQRELALQQMRGTGGLFSAYFKTDQMEKMEAFVEKLNHFLLAVSWGGHESLIMPSVAFYNIPGRENTKAPWNLVRFYIGLEDPDWLIEDLKQALVIL